MMDIFEELVDDAIFSEVVEEHRMIQMGMHCPYKDRNNKGYSPASYRTALPLIVRSCLLSHWPFHTRHHHHHRLFKRAPEQAV